eukprot:scaffold7072_cov267-Pinguiococcus_pyrenoidosus.AAC.11
MTVGEIRLKLPDVGRAESQPEPDVQLGPQTGGRRRGDLAGAVTLAAAELPLVDCPVIVAATSGTVELTVEKGADVCQDAPKAEAPLPRARVRLPLSVVAKGTIWTRQGALPFPAIIDPGPDVVVPVRAVRVGSVPFPLSIENRPGIGVTVIICDRLFNELPMHARAQRSNRLLQGPELPGLR